MIPIGTYIIQISLQNHTSYLTFREITFKGFIFIFSRDSKDLLRLFSGSSHGLFLFLHLRLRVIIVTVMSAFLQSVFIALPP